MKIPFPSRYGNETKIRNFLSLSTSLKVFGEFKRLGVINFHIRTLKDNLFKDMTSYWPNIHANDPDTGSGLKRIEPEPGSFLTG